MAFSLRRFHLIYTVFLIIRIVHFDLLAGILSSIEWYLLGTSSYQGNHRVVLN